MNRFSKDDLFVILTLLFKVPLWPDGTDAANSIPGHDIKKCSLLRLCDEGLLSKHTAHAQLASDVACFYAWIPGKPTPAIGAFAWKLSKFWERLEPTNVTFFTATDRAARHFGRTVTNPLKSITALSHNLNFAQCFFRFAAKWPLLVDGWVCEELVASGRGYGEKVVDACIVDSTSTPALAIEFAGPSYANSNGKRLGEIHADCAARRIPYEIWTISERTAL